MANISHIGTEIVAAMRAKDSARLAALRNLKTALANELLALKRGASEALTDDEAQKVVRRLIKQRKNSILQFRQGGREDLVKDEEAELKLLETYLSL